MRLFWNGFFAAIVLMVSFALPARAFDLSQADKVVRESLLSLTANVIEYTSLLDAIFNNANTTAQESEASVVRITIKSVDNSNQYAENKEKAEEKKAKKAQADNAKQPAIEINSPPLSKQVQYITREYYNTYLIQDPKLKDEILYLQNQFNILRYEVDELKKQPVQVVNSYNPPVPVWNAISLTNKIDKLYGVKIDASPIGASTPSEGYFTNLTSNNLSVSNFVVDTISSDNISVQTVTSSSTNSDSLNVSGTSTLNFADIGDLVISNSLKLLGRFIDAFNSAGNQGQVLTSTGTSTKWVDASELALGSINQHSDINTASTTPAVGQVLKWDGSAWVPNNDSSLYKEDGVLSSDRNIELNGYSLSIDNNKLFVGGITEPRIGIGTTNPERPLHISGDYTFMRADRIGAYGPAWLLVRKDSSNNILSSWMFGPANIGGVSNDDFAIVDYGTAVSGTGGTARLVISKNKGNVGVGTVSPTDKLHVAGNIRIEGALKDSANQAGTVGQILTSTATGTAWMDPSVAARTFIQGANDITVTGDGSQSNPYIINFTETHTTFSNLQNSGKIIATFRNENADTFDIRETVTSLTYNSTSTTLSYTNEDNITNLIDLSGLDLNIYNKDGVLTENRNVSLNGNNLAFDTNTLFINGTNGRVGIGTSNPGSHLEIFGTNPTIILRGDGVSYYPELRFLPGIGNTQTQSIRGSGNFGLIYSSYAHRFDVTNLANALKIDSDGNLAVDSNVLYVSSVNNKVGIGTSAPTDDLHIAGDLRIEGTLKDGLNSSGINGQVLISTGTSTQWVDANSLGVNTIYTADGILADNRTVTMNNKSLTFDGGRVGINKTANSFSLEVKSTSVNAPAIATYNTLGNMNATLGSLTNDNGAISVFDRLGNYKAGIKSVGASYIADGLGIGILNPAAKLHVNGSGVAAVILAHATDGVPSLKLTSDNNTPYLQFGSGPIIQDLDNGALRIRGSGTNSYLVFDTDSTERMRITNAGNVGIGVASPTDKLHVAGDVRIEGALKDSTNNAGIAGQVLTSTATGTQWIDANSLGVDTIYTADGTLSNQRTINLNGNNLIFDGAGNIGIGTTNPVNKLQVNGNVRATRFAAANGTAGSPSFRFDSDADTGLFTPAVNSLAIATGAVERVRITDSGNVGIGTVSPTERLQVAGNIAPSMDLSYTLGTPGLRWSNLYVGDITANTISGALNPGFSQGSVVFAGSGGVLSEDNSNFFWDNTNKRLGIGTAAPAEKLHVAGKVKIGNALTLSNTNNVSIEPDIDFHSQALIASQSNFFINIDSDNNENGALFIIKADGSTSGARNIFAVQDTGRVGINTTSPQYSLDVNGTAAVRSYLRIGTPSAGGRGAQMSVASGTNRFYIAPNDGAGGYRWDRELSFDPDGLAMWQAEGGLYAYGVTDTTLTGGEILLIGNKAGVNIAIDGDEIMARNNGSVSDLHLQNEGGNVVIHNSGLAGTQFIFTNAGNLGVGTTSPQAKLDVEGDADIGAGTTWAYLDILAGGAGKDAVLRLFDDADYWAIHHDDSDANKLSIRYNNSAKLTVDISGNVGIGASAPTAKLDVIGNAKIQGSLTVIGDGIYLDHGQPVAWGSNSIYGYSSGTDAILFNTAGAERVRIDASGNVGIGVASPQARLDIVGDPRMLISNTDTDSSVKQGLWGTRHYNNAEEPFYAIQAYTNQTQNILFLGGGTNYGNAATDIRFNTAADNATTVGTTRMVINSAGNVGIGTTAPTQKLDVAGNIRIQGALFDSLNSQGTQGQVLTVGASGNIEWQNPVSCVIGGAKVRGNGTVLAKYGNISTITRTGAGQYTINFANSFANVNDYYAHVSKVENSGVRDDVNIDISSYGTNSLKVIIHEGDNGSAANNYRDRDFSITIFDSQCTALSRLASSDERLKINIQKLDPEDTFNRLLALNAVRFNWDVEKYPYRPGFDDKPEIGFIAQEVKEVFPEVVDKAGDGYYTLDYEKLTAVTVSGVKYTWDKLTQISEKLQQIWEKLTGLEEKTKEIDMLKRELCEKDGSYSWCPKNKGDSNRMSNTMDSSHTNSSTSSNINSSRHAEHNPANENDDESGLELEVTESSDNETSGHEQTDVSKAEDANQDNEQESTDGALQDAGEIIDNTNDTPAEPEIDNGTNDDIGTNDDVDLNLSSDEAVIDNVDISDNLESEADESLVNENVNDDEIDNGVDNDAVSGDIDSNDMHSSSTDMSNVDNSINDSTVSNEAPEVSDNQTSTDSTEISETGTDA